MKYIYGISSFWTLFYNNVFIFHHYSDDLQLYDLYIHDVAGLIHSLNVNSNLPHRAQKLSPMSGQVGVFFKLKSYRFCVKIQKIKTFGHDYMII